MDTGAHLYLPETASSYPSACDWLAAFHLKMLQAILFIAV
jgi:hypothetical protein